MIEESRIDVRICSKEMVDSARKNSRFYPSLTYFCIKRFFMFPTLHDYNDEEFMIIPEKFFMSVFGSYPNHSEDITLKNSALKYTTMLDYKLITGSEEAGDEFKKCIDDKLNAYEHKEAVSGMAKDITGFIIYVADFREKMFGGVNCVWRDYEIAFCAKEIKFILDTLPLNIIAMDAEKAKEMYIYSVLKLARYSQFDKSQSDESIKKIDKRSNEYVRYQYNESAKDMAGRLIEIVHTHLKNIKPEQEQIIQQGIHLAVSVNNNETIKHKNNEIIKQRNNEIIKYKSEIGNYKKRIGTLEEKLNENRVAGAELCKTTKSLDEARKQYTSIIEENTLLKEEVESHKQKLKSQKSIDFKEIELDKYSSQIPKNEWWDFFYTYLIKKLKVPMEVARIITKNYFDVDAKKMISRAAADMSMSSFTKEKISRYTTIENALDYVSAALSVSVFEKNEVQIKKEFERIISYNAANNEKTEQYFSGLIKMKDMDSIIEKYEKHSEDDKEMI